MFTFKETLLPLVLEIIPEVFPDSRGLFLETFNEKEFKEKGITYSFVQDNQSLSKKGVLRGMHYQVGPNAQGKLVRVTQGAVLDVVVDIRPESKTFKKWYSVLLTDENMKILWVPPGFAHGFLSLAEGTIFQYKCTALYDREAERGFLWSDGDVAINWRLAEYGIEKPIISEKDQKLSLLN